MALSKVNYIDGQTVIYAQNLNDIQDEIIQNAEDISSIKKYTVSDPNNDGNLVFSKSSS